MTFRILNHEAHEEHEVYFKNSSCSSCSSWFKKLIAGRRVLATTLFSTLSVIGRQTGLFLARHLLLQIIDEIACSQYDLVRQNAHRETALRILRYKLLNLFECNAVLIEHALELCARFHLRFIELHLHAALDVHFSIARCLDRNEDSIREIGHYLALHAVRLSRRHASERLERDHHMRL